MVTNTGTNIISVEWVGKLFVLYMVSLTRADQEILAKKFNGNVDLSLFASKEDSKDKCGSLCYLFMTGVIPVYLVRITHSTKTNKSKPQKQHDDDKQYTNTVGRHFAPKHNRRLQHSIYYSSRESAQRQKLLLIADALDRVTNKFQPKQKLK